MAELHFLRPWWLAALPIGIWLIWRLFGGRATKGSWRSVVDDSLQPYVLASPNTLSERRWPLVVAATGLLAAVLGLAGPTWERLPVPAFRSDEALVVALDLSRSMDAADLEPSRLSRAKLKLLSLLERRQSGQTALVVFSAHAFTVTPLTSDTRTVASLVNALYSDIMPSRGSFVEAGLAKAGTLLRQTGLSEGEILLITDAEVSPQSLTTARELRREGYVTHVLAVGTEEGAPIAQADGGFVTDQSGQVVIPRLNAGALRRLADAGRGRFARITADDRDLDALFPSRPAAGALNTSSEREEEYEADIWRDQGIWLTIVLLPLLALGFRRGWICLWLVWLVLPVPQAQAFEWLDLWVRADQQAFDAMQGEQPARAAALFRDPQWRAAAQYRVGDFDGSVATLRGLDSLDAHYNTGNALARAGQLAPAIEAYDRALELNPDDEDARYNRDLLNELLEQNPQQNDPSDSQENSGDSSGQGEQSEGGQSEENQDESEQGEQSQADSDSSGRGDQQQSDAPAGSDDSGQDDSDPRQAEASDPQDSSGEPLPIPAPEDIEQWASEQAAEQWLRRVPQDPGGLLRRKFLYQYQRLGVDQDGNYVWPGDELEPW